MHIQRAAICLVCAPHYSSASGWRCRCLGSCRPRGEPARRQAERSVFELAIALNRLRNKEGTGHGRPLLSSVSDADTRLAIEGMGAITACRVLPQLPINSNAQSYVSRK
ncbi:abortive infection family protein [Trinickia symbiotica]|uniref:abortive infection family protein n=1 Tax=Trinickia symbiotica TaxID=863227 RepID=UPI001CB8AA4F